MKKLLVRAALVCAAATFVVAAPSATFVGSGPHKWLVVLCNFSDEQVQPNSQAYYQALFANKGGLGEGDYWSDVSFGQLDITGTDVTPWVQARDPSNLANTLTRGQWINIASPLPRTPGTANVRYDMIVACADGAIGYNYANYWGVVALFPEARSTTSGALDATQTSITLTTTQYFPDGTAPFPMNISDANGANAETVNVTGISGNTLTVQRGQGGTTAIAHGAGSVVGVPGDLGGVGAGQLGGVPLRGSSYTIATTILPHEIDVEGASHEIGHGHGYAHTRSFSYSTTDYGDSYDLMSAYVCNCTTFSANPLASNFVVGAGTDFGGTGLYNTVLGEASGSKGPGLDAINLDKQGWIPGPRHYNFVSPSQATITLHALGDPNALAAPGSEFLEANVPASVQIENQSPTGTDGSPLRPTNPPTCSGSGYGCTTSTNYSLDYRERIGWDRGFAASGVFVHLLGGDGRSYWVDNTPLGTNGELRVGGEYVDTANNVYVGVNGLDTTAHTAQVTIGSAKVNAKATYTGDTTGDFDDVVTLSGDLTVAASGAPIPLADVGLVLGTQFCATTTNQQGHASCQVRLNQDPGSYTVGFSYGGDSVYNAASTAPAFTITKEESAVAYGGAVSADYHDPFTASATLVDPVDSTPIAGKPVTFTLGAGDSCTATTDGSGSASCSITPTQAPGTYSVVASFAGDVDYLARTDAKAFTVTREETTTAYTGPVVIAQGQPVTLTATTLEDGTAAPAPAVTVTLSVAGQSCTGTSDPSGHVSCTIPSVAVALGPQPLAALFAGDTYYLPSSDTSRQAIVFAFPERGAFVLGDAAVAGASPSTTVTWWSSTWSALNLLTGGAANAAFKGFAETTAKPPACGGSWTSRPGNSAAPVASVPSYMGVVVSSDVTKAGGTFSGDVAKIVVVVTSPGYAADPGSAGTGTIVATYCP